MEVGDVRTHGHQLGFGFLIVLGIGAARVKAQVVKDGREHLVGRIHEGHAAGVELLQVLWLEEHGPGVDLVDAEYFFDLGHVVANAIGAPQVRHRIQVARIVDLQLLQQRGIKVLPVRQQTAVELLERARFDLLAKEMVGRHHDVVAGTARQQFAFQGFVGVKHVIHGFDASRLLEVGQGGFADVVRPVVDIDHGFSGLHGADADGGGQ